MTTTITGPGIYPDMTDAEYHADPVPEGSLSASGAKTLLDCPAKFNYRKLAGEEHRDFFDFGKAAHAKLLGVGAPIAVLDFKDRRSKAYSEAEAQAYANGHTPMLKRDAAVIESMVAAVQAVPLAAALLDPARGPVEQSLFWHDLIWRRARLDLFPDPDTDERPIIVDYKTAADASPKGFQKSSANFDYFIQAAWYLDGYRRLTGRDDAAFVFVVQEKEPPYVVGCYELTESYRRIGEWRAERAVAIYQRCTATGIWPAYSEDVERIDAPRWLEIEHEEQLDMTKEGAMT
jgi:hypothetical protein